MPKPRSVYAVLLLILFSVPAGARADSAGLPLLGNHDFQTGGYSLVGLFWNGPRHPVQDELGQFYVDDPAVLAEMQAEWRTGEPAPFYACGYHYTVLLVRGGEAMESLAINLETECGTVVVDGKSYRFDVAYLTRHADRYRKPIVDRRIFPSLAEARGYLDGIDGDQRLLFKPEPHWRKYDGEFRFTVPCPDHDFNSAKRRACFDRVRAEFETIFPGEVFDLSEAGSSSGVSGDFVTIEMKCSKPLHDRFDLYEDDWKWRDYEPALTLYWKQPQ